MRGAQSGWRAVGCCGLWWAMSCRADRGLEGHPTPSSSAFQLRRAPGLRGWTPRQTVPSEGGSERVEHMPHEQRGGGGGTGGGGGGEAAGPRRPTAGPHGARNANIQHCHGGRRAQRRHGAQQSVSFPMTTLQATPGELRPQGKTADLDSNPAFSV